MRRRNERLAIQAPQHPGVLCVVGDWDSSAFHAPAVAGLCGGGEMMKRHVVECIWRGYNGQLVPCHRSVIRYRKEIEALQKIRSISFTDNTTMTVTVRPATSREKVKEIRGYDELLSDCVRLGLTGFVHVNLLQKERDK